MIFSVVLGQFEIFHNHYSCPHQIICKKRVNASTQPSSTSVWGVLSEHGSASSPRGRGPNSRHWRRDRHLPGASPSFAVTYGVGTVTLTPQPGTMHIPNSVTRPRSRSPPVVTSQVEARSPGLEACAFPAVPTSEVIGFSFDVMLLLFLF